VERRGLAEADTRCRLFDADVRAALDAGIVQTRGALLREGWSSGDVRELERVVISAASARDCTDRRTVSAAANARAGFTAWVNANSMVFPGWDRPWLASRTPGANGWALRQDLSAPLNAAFGVRTRDGVQILALAIPLARGQDAPTSAHLLMRNRTRTGAREISLPQRVAYGLAAGAPAPNAATTVSSTRSVERLARGAAQALFVFPDSAFRDLLALDPRESLELRIVTARGEQRVYVEVGDIAAARAFLTMRGS
jgi:hypothetical protein